MKKKIIVKAPILSRSGYGEQSRIVLRALRTREDIFDIYLINIPWGRTAAITSSKGDEFGWINEKIWKTGQLLDQQSIQFDVSLQITIPNEFEKMAPVNIGHTAGIETNRVAPEWIKNCNELMDKVITISEHSKKGLAETRYNVRDPSTGHETLNWGMTTPVDVVGYPVYTHEPEEMDIEFTTDKNFLVVSQWGIRKNLLNTIKWFIDEFRDDADVGLILKTNTACDSITDRENTSKSLENLLNALGERKCKVYLIHGELTPGELTWIYQHPTMKALINISHGEGFGLPLFEAAYNGLPLVTVTWSGQMDFICKTNKKGKRVPLVSRVDYDLKPVQKDAVWNGVVVKDSMWAYARETSYKRACREILTKEKHFRNQAQTLQKYILNEFSEEKIYKQLLSSLGVTPQEKTDYVFVSDAFVDQYIGGAELSLQALIDTCPGTKTLLNSVKVSKEAVDYNKDATWIFGNIAQLTDHDVLHHLVDNGVKYHFIEFDYKFCEYRNPLLYEMLEDEKCEYSTTEQGQLITKFVNNSVAAHFMSQKQLDLYVESLEGLDTTKLSVLSSVFGDQFFENIESLTTAAKDKTDEYLVLGSRNWVKGFKDSENWCKSNDIKYSVINGLSHQEVLEKLASAKGICFKPSGLDTCPRYVIEAKLLGCELELNENVQHLGEPWFDTDDTSGILDYLRSRREVFWNSVTQANG